MAALPEITHRHIATSQGDMYVYETGENSPNCLVFLHGWPEDQTEWQDILTLAGKTYHCMAFDLPGIGRSSATVASGQKTDIADTIHEALQTLGRKKYIIVGHDIGAMVTYAYLRKFSQELAGAILLSAAIPGIAPWKTVLQNPYIWHFAFHAVPGLPEKLVSGNQRTYFDYFFDILTHQPAAINDAARERYALAYASPAALRTGFDWYRAFGKDAKANESTAEIHVPLLYLRGQFDAGNLDEYVDSLHKAGVTNVTPGHIAGCKHYIPEENPAGLWAEIAAFSGKVMS